MPTYLYQCAKCGEEVEAWQSFTDEPLKRHSGCGGKLTKVLQPVGIVFKGSGFHRTDSRSGSKRSTSSDRSSDTKDTKSDKSEKSGTSDSNSSSDGKKDSSSSSDTKKPKAPATSS